MASEKKGSFPEIWAARYDDRDDEDLACERWALRLAARDQAMAQPVSHMALPDQLAAELNLRQAANDSTAG